MSEFILPFILTLIAGLSTMIGTLIIFTKYNKTKLTIYSLAFASGIMISISLFDLIQESLKLLTTNYSKNISFLYLTVGISIGVLTALIIEKLIPENKNVQNKKMYKVGVFNMLAIIIHNLPEGIITFLSAYTNIHLGITLTIAIIAHNIPEGIIISAPVYEATKSKKRAVGDTLISSMAEPLGGLLAYLFLKPIMANTIMGFILAFTSGIMLYIGVFKLSPFSIKYKFKTLLFFILGILIININNILT